MIFSEDNIIDLLMHDSELNFPQGLVVDDTVNIEKAATILENIPLFIRYNESGEQMTVEEFDRLNQASWRMPQAYKDLDIAEYVLSLCNSSAELQRCGHELLLYQERDLFDLLKFLKYLVDTMTQNHLIWGVGRGSSVSSYVLYKLGVHKIDSLFYDLDPEEFLR